VNVASTTVQSLRYGAPPHGGIALGFDRLCAILCNTPSIRDVIAFPKTAKGVDLMTDTPTPVSPKQLRELYIDVKVKKAELQSDGDLLRSLLLLHLHIDVALPFWPRSLIARGSTIISASNEISSASLLPTR
jgi:hypothetical protein